MQALTFVILSTTDWDAPQFGSRQQIALRLARRGHRVLFVEIPRALHSLISDPAGTYGALRRMGQVRRLPEGPLIYTPPPVLPIYYNPAINAVNQRLLLSWLRRPLARLGWQADVLWTYWPNTASLVGRLGEQIAVYHCIDDFVAAGYPLTPRSLIARMEARQCRAVDLIFARTPELVDARRRLNPNTYLLAGGVDTEAFDPALAHPEAEDLAALPRPRAGFVGTLDDRVDVELLAACARHYPEVTFALVGPIKRHRVDVAALEAIPNVHLLPPRPHTQIPAAVAALDVCLIPYRINSYTRGLSPIKLYEYLAMGKPVVSVDLPYVLREAEHVRVTQTAEQYIAAVGEALAHPPGADKRARWRAVAEANSWDRQVDEIERHLARRLG